MITVKRLQLILNEFPDEAKVNAYEGEDTGIVINLPDGTIRWIRARNNDIEDNQPNLNLIATGN